jgi:uncharacterized membrane protein
VLWWQWPHLPSRWTIHWGSHGQPDGWATKTVVNAFFPLGFGIFLCSLMEGVVMFLLAYPRADRYLHVSPQTVSAITVMTAESVRIISVGFAVMFVSLALILPLGQPRHAGGLVISILILLSIGLAISMWRLWHNTRVLRARGLITGLEGWNGLIYRNAQDPRVWVPKIAGVGYTLNFAHGRAWWWLLALLALPLLAIFMTIIQLV